MNRTEEPIEPNGRNGQRPWGEPAIEASGLGMRYRRRGWALRDCSFRLPAGRICGLVGPNGAGKSTLMSLVTGMTRPTAGRLRVFGAEADASDGSLRTAFLSQDKPLFRRFTVAETLRMGARLNPSWDQETAEAIVRAGDVPLAARIGTLSGGQRTRVAFALAFGKRPDLLVLDEPMADLDPLVRKELTAELAAEAAAHGTTVLISTHMLSELEDLCDYLLVIADGSLRLAGAAHELFAAHALVDGDPTAVPAALGGHHVIESRRAAGRAVTLVRLDGPPVPFGSQEVRPPGLEDLLLGYLRSPEAPRLICPSARVGDIEDAITNNPTTPPYSPTPTPTPTPTTTPTHPNASSEERAA
ncbi:ABC transporter ATP-binding protein [Streptomyces sp. NPDC093109]|uniref:ABC transporter ATP-binding protein n=1 Tax=Streptomyces sp. NPDC093109 TaxID=3154977 RepID=UPI00344C770B